MASPDKNADTAALTARIAQLEEENTTLRRELERYDAMVRDYQRLSNLWNQLVKALPVGIVVHHNGIIQLINPVGVRMMAAREASQMIGKPIIDFVHPYYRPQVSERIQALLDTANNSKRAMEPFVEEKFIRLDGETIDVEVSAFPLTSSEGADVIVIFRDITEKKRQQQALEQSEKQFRMLAKLLPASVFIVNDSGEFLFINTASEDVSGFKSANTTTANIVAVIDPDSLKIARKTTANLKVGETANFEIQKQDRQGNWQWLDVTMLKTVLNDNTVWLGVAFNITWRKQTEQQLKNLAQQLVEAYEEERARIARELHDAVGQKLIGLKFALENIHCHDGAEEEISALGDAHRMLTELTSLVREMSLSFRPSMLDNLGLLPTFLWYFERYSERYDIQLTFNHAGIDRRFPGVVEITAYRVIQEALTNVVRHAHVKNVGVSVQAMNDHIHIRIHDDGVGFDINEVRELHDSRGLTGMRERVELLGGDFLIESEPGGGVTITASIPLPTQRDEG